MDKSVVVDMEGNVRIKCNVRTDFVGKLAIIIALRCLSFFGVFVTHGHNMHFEVIVLFSRRID